MNFLSAILTFIFVGILVVLAMPVLAAGISLVVVLACAFVWFLPILLIMGSDKTSGGEKLAWILAIIFLSWFAWIFYMLLAPLKPVKGRYRY